MATKVAKGDSPTRATRSISNEIRPVGVHNNQSVRMPRNIPGQGRKGQGNPFGSRLKRT